MLKKTDEWLESCVKLRKTIFKAYRCAKKKKGRTKNAVLFEKTCEEQLNKLFESFTKRTYKPFPFNAFVATKPVKREIFAAKFRDRIVHHWVMNEIEHAVDSQFIYDSYACRKGKGTLFGVKRLYRSIRKCSQNFAKETYVLKLDIKNFFMSLDRRRVWGVVRETVAKKYKGEYMALVLYLCETIVMHDPVVDCVRTSHIGMWDYFPKHKSLFYNKEFFGLPIGNLTSQFFANLYLTKFDRWIKETLKIKFYGRYVDDFYILGNDIGELRKLIPKIREFLKNELELEMHPNKIYLQNIKNGVEFLGARVFPHKIQLSKRCLKNMQGFFDYVGKLDFSKFGENELKLYETRINSYLGICVHINGFNLKKRFLDGLNNNIWDYMYHNNYEKVNIVKPKEMFSFLSNTANK